MVLITAVVILLLRHAFFSLLNGTKHIRVSGQQKMADSLVQRLCQTFISQTLCPLKGRYRVVIGNETCYLFFVPEMDGPGTANNIKQTRPTDGCDCYENFEGYGRWKGYEGHTRSARNRSYRMTFGSFPSLGLRT